MSNCFFYWLSKQTNTTRYLFKVLTFLLMLVFLFYCRKQQRNDVIVWIFVRSTLLSIARWLNIFDYDVWTNNIRKHRCRHRVNVCKKKRIKKCFILDDLVVFCAIINNILFVELWNSLIFSFSRSNVTNYSNTFEKVYLNEKDLNFLKMNVCEFNFFIVEIFVIDFKNFCSKTR